MLLISGGAGIALHLLRKEQNKLVCVEALARLLDIAFERIKNNAMSARDILRGCDRQLFEKCLYDEELGVPDSFSELLYGSDISDAEARELFRQFCEGFGTGHRAGEAERCEYYASHMHGRAETLRAAASGRKKTVVCLCVSLTLIVLILLL